MFLLRWIFRVVLRRFGWVAIVAAGRSLARRGGQRRIDEATAEAADKMPDTIVSALKDAPGDPLRMMGTAMVAGRSARRAAGVSKAAAGTAGESLRVADQFRRSVSQWRRALSNDVRDESDELERELWSDYHRSRGDHRRADLSLLDARAARHGDSDDEYDALWERVPPESVRGRFRHRRAAADKPRRVRRTYRPPDKPWER